MNQFLYSFASQYFLTIERINFELWHLVYHPFLPTDSINPFLLR